MISFADSDKAISNFNNVTKPLEVLSVPDSYNWLPPSELPSAVLELANLYAAYARDVSTGTHLAPTFADAITPLADTYEP